MSSSKLLNGLELAGFIMERQAHEVRRLRQAYRVEPKLAIIVTADTPLIDDSVRLKQEYGEDILVDVEVHRIKQAEITQTLAVLNDNPTVQAIAIQLPLEDPALTDELINLVVPAKDVEALGEQAVYDSPTPLAILWLLAGYNVELSGKQVLLIGRNRQVGAPLERILLASGIIAQIADAETPDLAAQSLQADVIITATGQADILQADMIKPKAVVIDAGSGDVAAAVYERDDLKITPQQDGVGPLIICALFENVIRAASVGLKNS
jgi:methylenetetrahydrofolate dehydrogenase (NADP+) / methenyltetrahydrofolate cyclohydrolase